VGEKGVVQRERSGRERVGTEGKEWERKGWYRGKGAGEKGVVQREAYDCPSGASWAEISTVRRCRDFAHVRDRTVEISVTVRPAEGQSCLNPRTLPVYLVYLTPVYMVQYLVRHSIDLARFSIFLCRKKSRSFTCTQI